MGLQLKEFNKPLAAMYPGMETLEGLADPPPVTEI